MSLYTDTHCCCHPDIIFSHEPTTVNYTGTNHALEFIASPKPGVSTTVRWSFTPRSSMSTVDASIFTVLFIFSTNVDHQTLHYTCAVLHLRSYQSNSTSYKPSYSSIRLWLCNILLATMYAANKANINLLMYIFNNFQNSLQSF